MRLCRSTVALLLIAALAPAALAEKETPPDLEDLPWDRGFVQLGGFLASLNSAFRVGLDNVGLGLDMQVESFLGLETTTGAFRLDGGYRFKRNGRHNLNFSWFSLNRNGMNELTEDVELPDGTVLPTGLTISSIFNISILKLKYEYSFLLDDRIDLRTGGGLYVMPIEFGLGELDQERTEESVTAPLPVVSLGFNFQMSPKWRLRQSLDFLFLDISGFRGSILDFNVALELELTKHFGVGFGIEDLNIEIESDKAQSLPSSDFVGSITFEYTGLQFYVRGRF